MSFSRLGKLIIVKLCHNQHTHTHINNLISQWIIVVIQLPTQSNETARDPNQFIKAKYESIWKAIIESIHKVTKDLKERKDLKQNKKSLSNIG